MTVMKILKRFVILIFIFIVIACGYQRKPLDRLTTIQDIKDFEELKVQTPPDQQKQITNANDQGNKSLVRKLAETSTDQIDKVELLSMEMALARALKKNLSLEVALWEISSKDGAIVQGKLWQNPELSLDVGRLLGKNGYNSVESQLQISQMIELGGKIKSRTKVAQAEKCVAIQEALTLRTEILTETSLLFMDVVEAQFKLEQQERNSEIAKTIFNVVSDRVKSGKVSPLEEKRALLVFNQGQLSLNQAKSSFNSSKVKLSKMWGAKTLDFEKVDFQLGIYLEPPALIDFESQILNNPSNLLGQLKVQLGEQRISLEKSNAVPDITVSAGLQKYEENSDHGFALGLSIPLNIFNKNQGNIYTADALKVKALTELKSTNNLLNSELQEVHFELQTSYKKLISLKTEIYPSAKSVFEDAQTGYQKGVFDFLTVLDAQRTLFEINIELIETETEYKKKLIKANSLIGKVELIK